MDEESIIQDVINGNEDAFRIIVDKYKNLIYVICKNIVKDPQEAENLTQETFLQAFQSLHRYEFKGFKNWIGRIAVNKSIDYKRKLLKRYEKEISYIEEVENVPNDEPSMQDRMIEDEERKKLLYFCGKLPDKYRIVIHKYYMENKSYREIAVEENISVKTVETRLYRGKKLLRENFREVRIDETP